MEAANKLKLAFRIRENIFILFETDNSPEDSVNYSIVDMYEYAVVDKSLWDYRPESEAEYYEIAQQISESYGIEIDGSLIKVSDNEMEELIL